MIQMRRNRSLDSSKGAAVEGVVDGLANGVLRGWAWFPGSPDTPARVAVHSDGKLLAVVDATAFRADLASAGKRSGHCAFEVALRSLPGLGSTISVAVETPTGARELAGSPLDVPASLSATRGMVTPDVLPLPMSTARLQGSLDACGPSRLRGWAFWRDDRQQPVTLRLLEGDREWLRFEASQWRADLAEIHQGDGSCGFDLPLPEALCDGQLHTLDLRTVDGDVSVLATPFLARAGSVQAASASPARHAPEPLQRPVKSDTVTLSVIVNFYNMQREAERTLTSLSRSYQTDIDDLDYEVLCIDNGSQPPLDPAWIASFGPEFRLIRPTQLHPSPCAAINAAALEARGQYLAILIDGAHLLTPGVFREARQAWREHSDAVVAVRHWFIGGDQRWLAMAGYSREQEDRLFGRIRWPSNGYELFRIGAPIGENPEPWFDGLSESNCLMLPTALYDRMGGMDEAFDEAGGGFANLDLCHRASVAADGPMVSLIGEASFHQFHGGTTTNVDDARKDERVRSYARNYRTLRGQEFNSLHRSQLQFRGRMPSEFATGVRQRVLLPMRLEVTEQVRQGQLSLHFDEGAQTYLQSVYGESGLQHEVPWLGRPTGVAPADLISLQDIIHQVRPEAVIVVGARAGLTHFVASMLDTTACEGARILQVNPADQEALLPARVSTFHGNPDDPHTLATLRHWTGSAESVLVLFAADPAEHFTQASLQALGTLVSHRSYLVCLGTLFGQPWLGYSTHQHLRTIHEFINSEPAFVIDRSRHRQLISTCPSGYLRKVGGAVTAATYDAALDDLGVSTSFSETSA